MDANQLRIWRKTLALTRPAAATALGVSEKSLWRYETGRSPIPEAVATAAMASTTAASSGEVAPPYAPDETPWTHPRYWRRDPAKKGERWVRVPPGQPLLPTDGYKAAPIPDEKPEGMTEEDYQVSLILQASKAKPAPPEAPVDGIDPRYDWDDE